MLISDRRSAVDKKVCPGRFASTVLASFQTSKASCKKTRNFVFSWSSFAIRFVPVLPLPYHFPFLSSRPQYIGLLPGNQSPQVPTSLGNRPPPQLSQHLFSSFISGSMGGLSVEVRRFQDAATIQPYFRVAESGGR